MPVTAKSQNKPQSTHDEIVAGLAEALDGFEPYHNQVLLGVYIKPNKTEGGIFLTDTTVNEDRYQGKVGVVLKCGPLAFENGPGVEFKNDVSVGDWVMYRVSDGFPVDINGVACRLIEDVQIRGRLTDPKTIY